MQKIVKILKNVIKNFKFWLQYFVVGADPMFYHLVKKYGSQRRLIVSKDVNVVVEGYPRSGNTFGCTVLKIASDKMKFNIKVSNHRHELGQIYMAIKYNIPVIVLFREPIEAVSSFVVREKVSILFALLYYIFYYSKILELKEKIFLLDFSDLIGDYRTIIKATGLFKTFPEINEDEIKNLIVEFEKKDEGKGNIRDTHIAYPNKKRELMKSKVKEKILKSKIYSYLLKKAENIYEKLKKNESLTNT